MVLGGSRINRGGGWAPFIFFERVGRSGRTFYLWLWGSKKNSNSCLVGSLSNLELIN